MKELTERNKGSDPLGFKSWKEEDKKAKTMESCGKKILGFDKK